VKGQPAGNGAGGPGQPAMYDPDIPMQHQIFLDLCKQIDEGLWVDKDEFPGGKELAQLYGVSKITAERALDRLVEHGWIERTRGRRPRVLRGPSPAGGDMPGLLRTGFSRPFTYSSLSNGPATAPVEACEAFGVSAGTTMWTVRRLRTWQRRPHSVTHNVQPLETGARHKKAELESKPMLAILAGQGKSLARATRQFSVRQVSGLEASALDITLGQATLAATFTMYDTGGSPLQWVRIQLHPDVRTPLESQDVAASTGWISREHL
jgi:GntR family transcriptional regulator